ncbi:MULTISPECIES: AAA-associated domain-containing protein [Acidianus]|uniref:ABC transporter ATP-binding protein n=1 Tax=Candidatus Acidianus copahuensis TaxID=1160895 RepID=A0A031LJM2_9CREN|nr:MULTISPECIES: AAA-associated domain-containing protein [Acidianus]EZQ01751.1 ABC transporter ATP-binding protein [Candidatus Acidianus copahuensis]NON62955.1 ABC transporter ATP-binding protein [Acidianus sp. RZ1]
MNVIDPSARVADLMGLLFVLNNSYEGKTDLYELEKGMEVDLDDLMPIVYTANYLGYITVGGGDIIITDKGIEFLKSNLRKRKELLRESLNKIEPFATAIQMTEFTLEELKAKLEEKGITTYSNPQGIYDLQVTITEWGVYSGLVVRVDNDHYKVLYDKS